MNQWFRIEAAKSDPASADIYLVDFIGGWIEEWWGDNQGVITAKAFIDELKQIPDAVQTIRLHVNSPGGDVFAAVQMANALRDQRATKGRRIEAIVEGLAASAASIVIMAGDTVTMGDNALLFVHNPLTGVYGYASDLRKAADELDTIRAAIIATYRWHSALSDEELGELMDAETWLDADDAITYGLATDKVEGLRAAALLSPKALATLKVPEPFKARVEALTEPPAPPPAPEPPAPEPAAAVDVLRLCREAEVLDLAEALVAEGATLEVVQARIDQERTRRADAARRAEQITALCGLAQVPDLAAAYIRGGMSVEAVREQLVMVTALRDNQAIDGSLTPDVTSGRKIAPNSRAVYAERNRAASQIYPLPKE
jgi:ATP-dependent protease ClpP protease subunit